MASRHGQFIWYELLTTDLDAAKAFYSDVIGWEIADAQMPDTQYLIGTGSEGMVSGLLQLTAEMSDGGARPAWLGYIAVDDVDDCLVRATSAGCKIYMPPRDIPDVGRFAMLADPQGVPVYVMTMSGEDAPTACHGTAAGHCAWNELATSDYDAALDFYTSEFRWQRGETMDMGAIGNYQILEYGGQSRVGVMPTFDGGPPPMWRYYFRVEKLAPAMEKIAAAGGTVIHGPQEVLGDDEIIVALDPQGAVFCLVASRN